jgi:hypothetical protein
MTPRSLLKKFQVHHDLLTLRPEELVTATYQALRRREPDAGGLKTYSDPIRNGRDLAWLLEEPGTIRRIRSESVHQQLSPRHCTTYECADNATSQECHALWDHIALVWSNFGTTDPY